MKQLKSVERIVVATGQANAQLGNGFRAVVVPESATDSKEFRAKHGFRPDCEIPGYTWGQMIQFNTLDVELNHALLEGVDFASCYAMAGYQYIGITADVSGLNLNPIIANAIGKWVLGHQRELMTFTVADFQQRDVLNVTQYTATPDQVEAGVVEPENKAAVQAALTFDAIPSAEEMAQRAELLVAIAKDSGCAKAMIGGAPFFMSTLERALISAGIAPVYAFSQRESVETINKDGSVTKSQIFRHAGFVAGGVA